MCADIVEWGTMKKIALDDAGDVKKGTYLAESLVAGTTTTSF